MITLPRLSCPLVWLFMFIVSSGNISGNSEGWKAGVARADITPQEPMWMSGYAGRDRPCAEMLHPLWVKALSLEDAGGNRAILVTMDICGTPKKMSDDIKNRLGNKYNLDRSQIILSFSHTHTGPLLIGELEYYSFELSRGEIQIIESYSRHLEDQIVAVASEALNSMEPVQIFSGNGVARFAVNRRNNREAELNPTTQLSGPVDHAVPVIKVQKKTGELLAVVFGYACHTTTLGIYEWSGDYAGFAQIDLEKAFPGTTAMFFAGTGADINPLPRRTIGYARQYGKTLAADVKAVISEPMNELESALITKYSEIDLPYATPPTREQLKKITEESSGYQQKWASKILLNLDRDKTLPTSYPYYPIQIWRIGKQNIVVLGGEVVVDYSLKLKDIMGHDLFVMAYANDDIFYIPSTRILREGGYEGVSSIMYTDRPSTWKANIEMLIINGVLELAGKAGVIIPEP